jgi:hypothetical protein
MSKFHTAIAAIALTAFGCGGTDPIDQISTTPPVADETASSQPGTGDALSQEELARLQEFYAALNQLEQARRSLQLDPQLTCTRYHESDRGAWPHINGYGAVSPGGTYRGAYQFLPSTWNGVAQRHGRPDLVGVSPDKAPWYDQDAMANALRSERGMQPWGGRCA